MKNCEKNLRICKNCKWHDNFTGVCFNGDSEYRADFTESKFKCELWEDVYSRQTNDSNNQSKSIKRQKLIEKLDMLMFLHFQATE